MIAENFSTFFSSVYDTSKSSSTFAESFNKKFNNYELNSDPQNFCVYIVDDIIRKLKRGNAAGLDNISCEHIQYSHPIVCSSITMLFNLLLKFSYVPVAFGEGIIIPIPKGDKKFNHNSIDAYRGITVSCILSKIFESCLLKIMANYFNTSDRQFGFKKKVGCNNAIFALRKTVDFFYKSTVHS